MIFYFVKLQLIQIFFSLCFRTKTRSSNVHSVSDVRTRKGVSLQPLLDSTAKNRDCSCFVLNRTPNQNLVPEPKNEVEEREQVQAGWGRRPGRLTTRVTIKQHTQQKTIIIIISMFSKPPKRPSHTFILDKRERQRPHHTVK